jgi:carbon monoxide dehydrogenase subunit G
VEPYGEIVVDTPYDKLFCFVFKPTKLVDYVPGCQGVTESEQMTFAHSRRT